MKTLFRVPSFINQLVRNSTNCHPGFNLYVIKGSTVTPSCEGVIVASEQRAQPTETTEIEEYTKYLLSIQGAHWYNDMSSSEYYWLDDKLWKGTSCWRSDHIVVKGINTSAGQPDMLVAWSTWDVFTKAWTAMTTDDNMWVTHSFTSEPSDHGSDHSEEADMSGKRLVIRRN